MKCCGVSKVDHLRRIQPVHECFVYNMTSVDVNGIKLRSGREISENLLDASESDEESTGGAFSSQSEPKEVSASGNIGLKSPEDRLRYLENVVKNEEQRLRSLQEASGTGKRHREKNTNMEDLMEQMSRLTDRMQRMDFKGEQGHSITHVKPPMYSGKSHENVNEFIQKFRNYCNFQAWNEDKCSRALPLYLAGQAWAWYDGLDAPIRDNIDYVIQALRDKFHSEALQRVDEQSLFTRCMSETEGLEAYIDDLMQRFARLHKPPGEQLGPFIHGLVPYLKSFVISKGPATIGDAIDQARLGESIRKLSGPAVAAAVAYPPPQPQPVDAVRVSHLDRKVEELTTQIKALVEGLKPSVHMVSGVPSNIRTKNTSVNCSFCSRSGHTWRECFARAHCMRENLCFVCRQPGHKKVACTKNKSEN